ncbi:uncharacterized protein TM35_000033010 [Trypanosoma theileri]|uniref:Uncharacterized protein n=1 Tax=Trypanosoma theileri TaxID=67003 RepID=A0A1X0P6Q1_9TRYP|nr:uncharacterized protein TM35_000033010 [Trypanosoma theileri]ORC92548.1 hypothetical protein TM35_000033010 [Trypanosoma theileri]
MSVKVPEESVQYQSHNHCKCDFCNSRRTVNEKKLGVSSRVADLQALQRQNNCCCSCHEVLAGRSLKGKTAPNFELDHPEHHVNQTELNARMGRTGLPTGDKYTISAGHTVRGKGDTSPGVGMMTREEREKAAMEDLDRLERLLILEHKSRVKAAADAHNLEMRQSTGKGLRPQPFDVTGEGVGATVGGLQSTGMTTRDAGMHGTPVQGTVVVQPGTIREAYDLAQRCSVTPPPHCEVSHRLQHTINDVRAVARDPVNRKNTGKLRHVLQREGVSGVTPTVSDKSDEQNGAAAAMGTTTERPANYFGPRPEGAGVVWRKIHPTLQGGAAATATGGIGNVDNRDLWKSTLVKGKSSKQATATDEKNTLNDSKAANGSGAARTGMSDLEKTSPGAYAALTLQQQHQGGRAMKSPTPIPTVRDAEDTRI